MSPIYHHQYDATVRHTSCVRRRRTRFLCLCAFCVSILCLSCVFACVWAGPYVIAVLIRFPRWFCKGNRLGNPGKSCPQLIWFSLADCTISFLRGVDPVHWKQRVSTCANLRWRFYVATFFLMCVFFLGSWRDFQILSVLFYRLELIKVALMTL